MWAYTDDIGPDDSAGGWGSNPVRRLFGPGTEWWVEECACCLCGCLSTGPVFIIIGLLFLVRRLTGAGYPLQPRIYAPELPQLLCVQPRARTSH